MTTRRKTSPNPIARATEPRPLAPATETHAPYVSVLARARALGFYAAVVIAPLGLAGSVSACGAARPVERHPQHEPGPTGYVPPVETIAPPGAAPSSSAPVPGQSE